MKLSLMALAAAVALSAPLMASAQTTPVVPALNGVNLAQLQAPAPNGIDRAMLERQQQAQRAAEMARGPVAQAGASPATPAVPATGQPAQQPAQQPVTGRPAAAPAQPPAVPKPRTPTPAAPTEAQIAVMERNLAIARSQARTVRAVESATVRGERAAYVRAKVIFPYNEKSIFEIHTSPERMTAIELQPGEKITTENGKPKAADTANWIVEIAESGTGATKTTTVLIKPTLPGLETNMLIPTTRRNYFLVLRADSEAYMPMVGFNYPFDEAQAQQTRVREEEVEEARREPVGVPPDQIRFGYTIKGSDVEWKPLRAFDDGTKTYVQMPPSMRTSEAPALFVLEDDKEPLLVNYRIKGDYYIVDRLFSRAQMRVGKKAAVNIYRDDKSSRDDTAGWFSRN